MVAMEATQVGRLRCGGVGGQAIGKTSKAWVSHIIDLLSRQRSQIRLTFESQDKINPIGVVIGVWALGINM